MGSGTPQNRPPRVQLGPWAQIPLSVHPPHPYPLNPDTAMPLSPGPASATLL